MPANKGKTRRIARVNRNGKVGSGTGFVDVVGRFISPLLEVRSRRDGHVAARRETDYADSLRKDAPFDAFAPDQADGSLRAPGWIGLGLIRAAR